jgi:hypothetical protein
MPNPAPKKPSPTPKSTPKVKVSNPADAKTVAAAEQAFKKMLDSGKVKSITEARKQIAKKYGVSPNGYTN